MTTLNLSVTPEAATMSQDCGLWIYPELAPVDAQPTGEAPAPVEMREITKIHQLPGRRVLIGAAGSATRAALFPVHLQIREPDRELDELMGHASIVGCLRNLVLTVDAGGMDELLVIVAGWSEREGRVVGYAFQQENGFVPQRLDAGVTQMPAVHPSAPGYEGLTANWREAIEGRRVEELHERLQGNQFWQYREGLLRPGVHLTASYDLATVDQHGVRFQEQRAAAA